MTAAPHAKASLLPVLAVSFGAALWGAWWIPLRAVQERGVPGDWSGSLLYLAGGIVLLPAALWRIRAIRPHLGVLSLMALLSGTSAAAFNHGITHGEVVRVTLLFFLTPVWASLFGAMFLGNRPTILRAASIVLGLGGAAVVLGYGGTLPVPHSSADWGGLISGILWGASLTLFRREEDIPSVDKSFCNFIGAAIGGAVLGSLPGAPPLDGALVLRLAPLLLLVGALYLVPMVLVELWGASRLDPGRTGVLMLMEVLVSAVTAPLIAGESFGMRETLGCVLILGAGIVEFRDHRRA